jgi:hypothetical protein
MEGANVLLHGNGRLGTAIEQRVDGSRASRFPTPANSSCHERLIESCEHCNPEGAEIPFDNILDRVTGSDPSVTDYILESPAKCPNCRRDVLEKTLVEPA